MKTTIVGEIGINHNGKLENAIKLINLAKWAGFDAVKFQKRNPELYPEKLYDSPIIGQCTYREHKRALELSEEAYGAIDDYCKEIGIEWFASCFDKESVDFIAQFKPKYWKIASPCITDLDLVGYIAKQDGTCLMSMGMSTDVEVMTAIDIWLDGVSESRSVLCLMHCCSEYPCPTEHVNLLNIPKMRFMYGHSGSTREIGLGIGYSSHDAGVPVSVAAVALGAEVIEVHITLDRAMPGSDHAASLEREEMERLVRHIRAVEKALGSSEKQFYEGERKIREKVSKVAATA